MNLMKAENLANKLLRQHGLTDWSFGFDSAIRRAGACHYNRKAITLSAQITELNDESVVTDTILHEIAHALAPRHANHGREWKQIARSIGCSTSRCYGNETVTPPKKYIGECPNGHVIKRHRRARLSCGKCSGRFDEKYLFKYRLNMEGGD